MLHTRILLTVIFDRQVASSIFMTAGCTAKDRRFFIMPSISIVQLDVALARHNFGQMGD